MKLSGTDTRIDFKKNFRILNTAEQRLIRSLKEKANNQIPAHVVSPERDH